MNEVYKKIVSSYIKPALGIGLMAVIVGLYGHSAYAADSTLTITLSENAVTANVAPTATASGTFIESSGITIGVSTNNVTGYKLMFSASDTTTPGRLKLSGGTAYLQSLASATSLSDFRAMDLSGSDLATSLGLSDCTEITENSDCKGVWGYKPSKLNSDANTDFLPAPGAGAAGDTIDQTSEANATPTEYTIALGAKVSPLATVGSYTNTFNVRATANPIPYTIIYEDNIVDNMPMDVSDSGSGSVQISENTPTRAGYTFLGWCSTTTGNSNGADTCSGTTYRQGDNITLDSVNVDSNNFRLYAMWKEQTYLQNLSADKCTTTMSTAIDSRDGTEYHIQRLADDKCWLLDNLALDLTDSAVLNGMNENNTHASNTTLGYLKNGGGTTSDKYATAAVSNWTSSYSYSAPLISMADKDKTAPTGTSSDPKQSLATSDNWKYGGYYNYCAASAGSYCYGNGTSAGTSSDNATEDICPAGWRMPGGSSTVNLTATPPTGEYQTLYSNANYNTYDKYREALRLPLSGYFRSGSARTQGSYGFWWSSTRGNDGSMYDLYADTSNIIPANYNYRGSGYSVRCVLGS